MQDQTEKQNNEEPLYAPPRRAYVLLACLFLTSFAFIYSALVLFAHYKNTGNGILQLTKAETNVLYVFVVLLFLVALYVYFALSRQELLFSLKRAAALVAAFTFVVIVNIVLIAFDPYLLCVSMTPMLVLPFTKKSDAFVMNAFACWLSSFVLSAVLEIGEFPAVAFTLLTGLVSGAAATYLFPKRMTRVISIVRSVAAGAVMIIVYFVLLSSYNLSIKPFQSAIAYIGVAAAGQVLLSSLLVPIIEWAFNLISDYKLMELVNHKAPLIKRLSTEAPGTFNHSLAVANFAEICADAIGEDPYLARACAYYHDVGKLNNVEYFTENQAGYNPHDEILPEVSAEIIRNHTSDGYELCKKHRVPEEIARITIQHHGTLPIVYFLNKAKSLTDGEVDPDDYRYFGETPTGKIGAIMMICDSAEAAIRAMDNPTGEKVDKLVKGMIDERLRLGQFDNCDITMKDLTAIRSAIVGAYGGLFHKRIKYNNGKKDSAHV